MRIVLKKEKMILVWLSLYIFLAIYAPPFLPVNAFHFIALFSFVNIILKWNGITRKAFNASGSFDFLKLISVILCSILIGSIMGIWVNDNRLKSQYQIYLFYQSIVLMLEILVCIIYICTMIWENSIKGKSVLQCFMWVAFIEFIFVAISYVSPSIRRNFLSMMGANTGLSKLYSNYNDFLSYRGYGFALELLDTFGYGTGILAGIAFVFRKISKKSYIIVVCALFATLLNSRTGLIVFAVFVAIDLFMGKNKYFSPQKILFNFSLIVLFLLTWFIIAPIILQQIFVKTQEQIIKNTVRDLIQVLNFNYHTLRAEMWVLPQSILHLLFGTGHLVNETISTVGFVNSIWSFGFIGSIILDLHVIFIFRKILKNMKNNRIYYNIVLSLLVVFFVVQLKMPVFTYSAGGFSLFALPFILNFCAVEEAKQ